jgi:HSP20 family protein
MFVKFIRVLKCVPMMKVFIHVVAHHRLWPGLELALSHKKFQSTIKKKEVFMNLLVRNSLPSMLMDWPMPGSLFGPDFLNENFEFPSMTRLGITVPSANVTENAKEYKIELAAPGLERKDFKIEVENHCLTISSEKEEEKKEKEDDYTRREYSFHSFSRSFTLPENIKEGSIDARYENGVLKVAVPKLKETPVKVARQIAVS